MSSSQNVIDYRQRRKANLIKVCGNKCCLCGYDKIQSALEFHHINPEEKEYGIAASGICHDLETDFAEMKKCILVCANCHREIHNGLYSQEELKQKQFFDEEIINQLREDKKFKEQGVQLFCKECGTKITKDSNSGLCKTCYAKSTRKVEHPSREELKQLIQQYNFTEIGRQFGVSDNSIRKWCKQENLPFRTIDIKQITDWDKI